MGHHRGALHLRARPAHGPAPRTAHALHSPGSAPRTRSSAPSASHSGSTARSTLWASGVVGQRRVPARSRRSFPPSTFTVFNVNVGYDQAITMGVALVSDDRPLPVLPLLAARRRDARRGRQPGTRQHHGHQPHRRAPVVVGDRHDLRRDVGRAPRAGSRVSTRCLLILLVVQAYRRRRDRLLLQPAPHLRRRPAARYRAPRSAPSTSATSSGSAAFPPASRSSCCSSRCS